MASDHTPEPWYAVGPLSEEESSRIGGTTPDIGIAARAASTLPPGPDAGRGVGE
jgi:hypothetical protein